MIEEAISPVSAEKRPWMTFVGGFVFTIVAGLLTLQIGTSSPCNSGLGLLFVAFITIAATPFFLHIFKIEEKHKKGNILQRHGQVIEIMGFFFLSIIFASSVMLLLLPQANSNYLFLDQTNDLVARNVISAQATAPITGIGEQSSGSCAGVQTGSQTTQADQGFSFTGRATASLNFMDILVNNLKVMALAFVFSFVYGAGAIFIIAWNATIIGVLIAKIAVEPALFPQLGIIGNNLFVNYALALPTMLLRLLPHGLFEFLAYFVAAIAGGILSVGIIQEKFKFDYKLILRDSITYLTVAGLLLVIGAFIETSL